MQPDLSITLWRRGRLRFIIEPRDAWVGVYVAAHAVYVCPVPFLVAKWERSDAA